MSKQYCGFLTICLLVLFDLTGRARAGIDACGNIDVEAEAQCELVARGVECEAKCTPLNVEAACASRLQVNCDSRCFVDADSDCAAECRADCTGPCEVDPGKFDCAAACRADCEGGCQGTCEASDNSARCESSCRANCSAECDGSCDVELPEVDCDRKCEASCDGSCRAEASVDCQVDCQNQRFANCEVEVTGGCKADCQGEKGAVFCDGRYVDHGNNLQNCLDALSAMVEIEGYASAESSCQGNACKASAEAGVSSDCSALPGRAADSSAGWWLAAILCLAVITRRRFFG